MCIVKNTTGVEAAKAAWEMIIDENQEAQPQTVVGADVIRTMVHVDFGASIYLALPVLVMMRARHQVRFSVDISALVLSHVHRS